MGTSINTANVLAATLDKTTTRARVLVPVGSPYLYVRLITKFSNGDVTKSSAYRISVASPAVGVFEIISPSTSGLLSDLSVTFQWTSLAANAEYYLFVGSAPGRADIFPRATRPEVLRSNSAVVDLRNSRDGRPVYVKVVGRAPDQPWSDAKIAEAKFVTEKLNLSPPSPPDPISSIAILQPTTGSTLVGPTLFLFSRGTIPDESDWAFTLGTTPGGHELYNSFGSELNQFRKGESAFVDTIPGSVTIAYATLSVKVGDSWYTTTAQYSVQVPTPSSSAISQFETCISTGTAAECVLPAGIYAFDLPASGSVGRFHITRSNLTVRGEGIETQEPFAAPAARTRLWRRSGCAPFISVAAGVQNLVVERMTLDGNNDVLANTCLDVGQPGQANDMFVHGRPDGTAASGQATSNLIIRRMYCGFRAMSISIPN